MLFDQPRNVSIHDLDKLANRVAQIKQTQQQQQQKEEEDEEEEEEEQQQEKNDDRDFKNDNECHDQDGGGSDDSKDGGKERNSIDASNLSAGRGRAHRPVSTYRCTAEEMHLNGKLKAVTFYSWGLGMGKYSRVL